MSLLAAPWTPFFLTVIVVGLGVIYTNLRLASLKDVILREDEFCLRRTEVDTNRPRRFRRTFTGPELAFLVNNSYCDFSSFAGGLSRTSSRYAK